MIGDLALAEGVAIHGLRTEQASLEEVFFELTGDQAGAVVTALVTAELLKLRTTRTAIGFLIATVLLTLLIQIVTFATDGHRLSAGPRSRAQPAPASPRCCC